MQKRIQIQDTISQCLDCTKLHIALRNTLILIRTLQILQFTQINKPHQLIILYQRNKKTY